MPYCLGYRNAEVSWKTKRDTPDAHVTHIHTTTAVFIITDYAIFLVAITHKSLLLRCIQVSLGPF